jgi:hypothetical protein
LKRIEVSKETIDVVTVKRDDQTLQRNKKMERIVEIRSQRNNYSFRFLEEVPRVELWVGVRLATLLWQALVWEMQSWQVLVWAA